MLGNYVKIALRNLLRHKTHTFINIAGLIVGLACAALILLYVRDELSFDRFHSKAANIYRLLVTMHTENGDKTISYTAAPMAETLANEYAEILQAVRMQPAYNQTLVSYQDKQFYEDGVYLSDDGLFDVLDFALLYGDPASALKDQGSVVLSRSTARKYFGDENPLGKVMQIERGVKEFKVTGVLQEIPRASSIRPDFILPFKNVGEQALNAWQWFGFPSYMLLADNCHPDELAVRLTAFVEKYYTDAPPGFPTFSIELQKLTDVHLHSDFDNAEGKLGAMTYLYLFVMLGIFMIGMACVNFMNLATARSQHRAREVGVRKVVGSRRSMLILQFISESVLLSMLAVFGAIVLVEFLLPVFNTLAQKDIQVNFTTDWVFLAGFFGLALIVGIVAGSYPAFFLSRFRPVEVLKGVFREGNAGVRLRQVLVVGQFIIAIVLIASSMVVSNQIEFIRNKRLGFDKEQILVVPLHGEQAQTKWPRLKTELLRHPEIAEVSASSSVPADPEWWRTGAKRSENSDEKLIFTFQVDYDFFETLGIQLKAGRFLSPAFPGDSTNAFVINETAVKNFGWNSAENAIGQSMLWLGNGPDNPKHGMVVGVVKDFYFRPLYEEVGPAVFHLQPDWLNFILIKVRPNSMKTALQALQTEWAAFDATHPLQFSFMDQKVDAQYGAEARLLQVFGIFTAFAIFISCLGLFGLAAFAAEERTKEIGIRKVLGASIGNLLVLLTGGVARLVMFSFTFATPIVWFAMQNWLRNFAYRTEIDWWVFAMSGGLALVIALVTVSWQAIRAALANPVESLRYE